MVVSLKAKAHPQQSLQPGDSYLTRPTYRPDIDGLRAIAVLCVVLFHAFPGLVPGGFIGVDIFFVISGLLISGIILGGLDREGGFSFRDFYARRIRRIFPALLLVLAACYAYGWFRIVPLQLAQFCTHITAGAGFVSNFLLWHEAGYFDAASSSKPLLHLWSLGIEEQFYLFLPVTLWAARKRRQCIPWLAFALFCISFALNMYTVGTDSVAAFYAPWTRMWELFLGVVLASLFHYRPQRLCGFLHTLNVSLALVFSRSSSQDAPAAKASLLQDMASVAGALAIAVGLMVIDKQSVFPGWKALLPTVGSVLILAAGKDAWLNRTVLSHKALVWLGLISYPLYLWHWPLLVGLIPFSGGLSAVAASVLRACVVLLSVLLAHLTYVCVEKPIRFGLQGGKKAAGAFVLMVLVGSVAWATHLDKGVAFRFPEELRELVTFTYDTRSGYREGVCFLHGDQDGKAFGNCTSGNEQGKSIVLWGDSHAAHLYCGLAAKTGETCKLTQYTASSCQPILGDLESSHPHCQQINAFVLEKMTREVPQQVVLSAFWRLDAMQEKNFSLLEKTIQRLRGLGVQEILLVGPSPVFADAPQNLLARTVMKGGGHDIPTRMKIDSAWFGLDARMAAIAKDQGITYVSPLGIMCNAEGCLVSGGQTPEDLYFWDSGHLTRAGSVYLAAHFPE